ncbi:hypothetical protein [Lacticaseibacillus saniviri]
MGKFYLYLIITIVLLGFAIFNFITQRYWQGAGDLFVGLIGIFITVGTYSDLKKKS